MTRSWWFLVDYRIIYVLGDGMAAPAEHSSVLQPHTKGAGTLGVL